MRSREPASAGSANGEAGRFKAAGCSATRAPRAPVGGNAGDRRASSSGEDAPLRSLLRAHRPAGGRPHLTPPSALARRGSYPSLPRATHPVPGTSGTAPARRTRIQVFQAAGPDPDFPAVTRSKGDAGFKNQGCPGRFGRELCQGPRGGRAGQGPEVTAASGAAGGPYLPGGARAVRRAARPSSLRGVRRRARGSGPRPGRTGRAGAAAARAAGAGAGPAGIPWRGSEAGAAASARPVMPVAGGSVALRDPAHAP